MDPVAQGYASYAAGMHASSASSVELRDDQLEWLVNGTVRTGFVSPRPWFRRFCPVFPAGQGERMACGKIQGSGYYEFSGVAVFVFVVDGNVFFVNPIDKTAQCVNPNSERLLSRDADFVTIEQRASYLLVSDAVNPVLVFEGFSGRQASVDSNEVAPCAMMADGWYRLVTVDPDRRRFRVSDHEDDPNSTPLRFTDASYLVTGVRYFGFPRRFGEIMGVAFLPLPETDQGVGPLIVFGRSGTMTYDISVPRSQWLSGKIAAATFPAIGSCSQGAAVELGTDLIFSDQRGRILSFRASRSDQLRRHVVTLDREIRALLRSDDPALLPWRRATAFDDRVIIPVRPVTRRIPGDPDGRFNVCHTAMAVLEGDVAAPVVESEAPVWVTWNGIDPAVIQSGMFPGAGGWREVCLALCVDSDGLNRLYEIGREPGPDVVFQPGKGDAVNRPVRMTIVPRWFDFRQPLAPKSIRGGFVRLSGISGSVEIEGLWQIDGSKIAHPYFTHRIEEAGELSLESLTEARSLLEPRLSLPAVPQAGNPETGGRTVTGYKMRPILRVTGVVTVEEMMIEADPVSVDARSSVTCQPRPRAVNGVAFSPLDP